MHEKAPPLIITNDEFVLSQRLLQEVGVSQEIFETNGDLTPFNPDLRDRTMAIRNIVRSVVLNQIGYTELDWIPRKKGVVLSDGEGIVHLYKVGLSGKRFSEREEINELVGKPAYEAYDWHRFCVWNVGDFDNLRQHSQVGAIVDKNHGVVLFSDEVESLAKSEIVTTYHSAGLNHLGFLLEERETFAVYEGYLHRARARFND